MNRPCPLHLYLKHDYNPEISTWASTKKAKKKRAGREANLPQVSGHKNIPSQPFLLLSRFMLQQTTSNLEIA